MADRIKPISMTATQVQGDLARLVEQLRFADPPSMVRVEPVSITGDPAPGAEARVADAAWMLGRQWQFGELTGEDAGSVVAVHVRSQALPVTAWAPLGAGAGGNDALDAAAWRPWRPGAVLEELVQHVPALGIGQGLRQRAEAGAQLVEQLAEAGEGLLADRLTADYPLALAPDPRAPEEPPAGETESQRASRLAAIAARDALDPQGRRLLNVLRGAVPDGGAVLAVLAAGEPEWLGSASAAARDAVAAWREWAGGTPDAGGAWSGERLEYRFALRFGDDDHAVVTRCTQFGAATVRWSDLEWVDGAAGTLPEGAPPGAPIESRATLLATPLRYPGMPVDRYWQLEDGRVDLGALEAQPHDLARLCLAEFAMTSGDDWLSVPVDGLLGAINQVQDVTLQDNFGDTSQVAEFSDPAFTMFRVTTAGGRLLPGIVLPPVAADLMAGAAVEEVLFLRDETANMAWAIEQTVQGRSGDPRSRASEPRPAPDKWPEGLDPNDRVYRLQTPIPAHWIPLVPFAPEPGSVVLRKGALLREGQPVRPEGVTLRPTPLTLPGEELPREGVQLRAVPVLARCADGRYARWVAYRVRTGRGEASSRLAWDAALAVGDQATG